MFVVEKFHNRMYTVNGEWYFDGEPITDGQASALRYHYNKTVERLKAPWHNRDESYDVTGRKNFHWRDND